uniref:Uncharacterized protein n=1 Tax=Oryza brachyantha TaxID=4533 RepID=J3N8B0_ORYBR
MLSSWAAYAQTEVQASNNAIEINEDEQQQQQEGIEDMFVQSPLGDEMFDVDQNTLDAMLRDIEHKEYNERDYKKFTWRKPRFVDGKRSKKGGPTKVV